MKKRAIPGIILTVLFLLISAAFIGVLMYTKMLPMAVIGVIAVILLVLVAVVGILVWNITNVIRFIMGTLLAIVFSAIFIVGGSYLYKTIHTLSDLSGVETEISQIGIYVNAEDTVSSIEETAGYTFGILSSLDRENADHAVSVIKERTGQEVAVQEYAGLTELADGILSGNIGAIILNEAYLSVIEDMRGYGDFTSRIRLLETVKIEEQIQEQKAPVAQKTASGKGKVYTVFISGIDNRGGIVAKSRSDVNIIATVNTETKQILLVSTPRDYFVPLSISGGQPDKLTHAGIYGISVCMDTLGMLYDIDINYYFRLNFSGFINIIDALGGITVVSDYEFDSGNELGYHFVQGENFVDGETALVFARERYAFEEGDRQRGRNQMAVIKGVINKALSPELLKNYSSVLSSLEGSFETNISYEEIAYVFQKQIQDGGSWNIVSYSVDGTGDTQKPYSMSQNAYVMVPDQATVDTAKDLMKKVREGETISTPE